MAVDDRAIAAELQKMFSTAWQQCWSPAKWISSVQQLAAVSKAASTSVGANVCGVLMENGIAGPKPSQLVTSYLRHGLSTGQISLQQLAGFFVRGDGYCDPSMPVHFQVVLALMADFMPALQTDFAELGAEDSGANSLQTSLLLLEVVKVLFKNHAASLAAKTNAANDAAGGRQRLQYDRNANNCIDLVLQILSSGRHNALLTAAIACEKDRWEQLQDSWSLAKQAGALEASRVMQINDLLAGTLIAEGWVLSRGKAGAGANDGEGSSVALRSLAQLEATKRGMEESAHSALVWEIVATFHHISLEGVCAQLWAVGIAGMVAAQIEVPRWTCFMTVRVPILLTKLKEKHGMAPSEEGVFADNVMRRLMVGQSLMEAAVPLFGVPVERMLRASLESLGLGGEGAQVLDMLIVNLAPAKREQMVGNLEKLVLDDPTKIDWTAVYQAVQAVSAQTPTWVVEALDASMQLHRLLKPLQRILLLASPVAENEMALKSFNESYIFILWASTVYGTPAPVTPVDPGPTLEKHALVEAVVAEMFKTDGTPELLKTAMPHKCELLATGGVDIATEIATAVAGGTFKTDGKFTAAVGHMLRDLPAAYFGMLSWYCEQLEGSVRMQDPYNDAMNKVMCESISVIISDPAACEGAWSQQWTLLRVAIMRYTAPFVSRNFQFIPETPTCKVLRDSLTVASVAHHLAQLRPGRPDKRRRVISVTDQFYETMASDSAPGGEELARVYSALKSNGAEWFVQLTIGAVVRNAKDSANLTRIRDVAFVMLMHGPTPRGAAALALLGQLADALLTKITAAAQAVALAELTLYVVTTLLHHREGDVSKTPAQTQARAQEVDAVLCAVVQLAGDMLDAGVSPAAVFSLALADQSTRLLGAAGLIPASFRNDGVQRQVQRLTHRLRLRGKDQLARGLFDLTSDRGREEAVTFYCLPAIPGNVLLGSTR